MDLALCQAQSAAAQGEVPVGVVMVDLKDNTLLFAGHNLVETLNDPTAHAEMVGIQATCRHLATPHLTDVAVYVTLEPCPMCAQALAFARVGKIIFGAFNPKGGGIDHGPQIFRTATATFRPQIIGGVRETACQALMTGFFKTLR